VRVLLLVEEGVADREDWDWDWESLAGRRDEKDGRMGACPPAPYVDCKDARVAA
jgi:hypothetical protein